MGSAVYQLQRPPPCRALLMVISTGGQGVHICFTICLYVHVNMLLIVRWGGTWLTPFNSAPPHFRNAIHAHLLFLAACAR